MAEIIQKDGTWTFDGDALRLTPGRDKNVSLLRRKLGELVVPLGALAGVSFEQGRKSGRLRLRLRDGADPLLHASGGRLTEPNDPYQLLVESDRYGVAEYFVDEVRAPCCWTGAGRPGDRVPAAGPDRPALRRRRGRAASFDGEHIRLEWNWKTEDAKAAAGARTLAAHRHHGRGVAPGGRPGERPSPLHRTPRAHQGAAQVRPQLRGAVGLQEGPADGPGRGGRTGPASASGGGRDGRAAPPESLLLVPAGRPRTATTPCCGGCGSSVS